MKDIGEEVHRRERVFLGVLNGTAISFALEILALKSAGAQPFSLEVTKERPIPHAEVTFLLWDTAGQEEYDAITRAYYKAGCRRA